MAVPTLGFAPGVLQRHCQCNGLKQLPYKWGRVWGNVQAPGTARLLGCGCQPDLRTAPCSLWVPRSFFCQLAEREERQSLGVSPQSCSCEHVEGHGDARGVGGSFREVGAR